MRDKIMLNILTGLVTTYTSNINITDLNIVKGDKLVYSDKFQDCTVFVTNKGEEFTLYNNDCTKTVMTEREYEITNHTTNEDEDFF